jgi:peptidoglycan/LPS O-acetylase OafA/YrhL
LNSIRLDLQVLRALAVISVVVYHLFPDLVQSGLLGVDVFFVLSGFLITSLIWRDFETARGKVLLGQLSRFWARRARRLLPAALLVLVTTFLLGLWLGPKTWWLDSSGSFFASSAYVANWYFGFEASEYLRADAAVSPYQHFWSLSVEEQFYVIWPLMVMVVLAASIKKKLETTIWLMVTISVLSFVFAIYSSLTDPAFGFYNTFTRIWEFGFGAVLALVLIKTKPALPTWVFSFSWLGLIAVMFIPHTAQSLIWQTLVAVSLSTLVILSSEGRLAKANLKPLHLVGDYSYGIYLWHWPVLILAPWVLGSSALSANWFEQLSLIGLTLLLAFLSKHFVEDPIRFGRFSKLRNLGQITILLAATIAIILSFAQIERVVKASASELSAPTATDQPAPKPLTPPLADLADDKPIVEGAEYLIRKDKEGFRVAELGVVGSERRIALVGDSHARQFYDPLQAIALQNNIQLDVISKSACSIQHPDDYQLDGLGGGLYCEAWNQQLAEYLADSEYELLITASSTLVHDGDLDAGKSFARATENWINSGHQVLVIRDNPKPNVSDPVSDFRYCIENYGFDAVTECGTPRDEALEPFDSLFAEASKVEGVSALDLTDVFCDVDWCPVIIDGVILYRDGSHITVTFAKTLQDEFEAELRRIGIL